MGEAVARQGVAVPSPGTADLTLVNAVQLCEFGPLRSTHARLLQRRHVRAGEHLVNPVELRAVRHLSRRVLALDEVKAVTTAEAGGSEKGGVLAGDVPPVKRVESLVGHRAEQRILVSHHCPVL